MNPSRPKRTITTTLLGILVTLAGGSASIFSFIAFLMAIKSPYSSSGDLLGIFLIFILPPVTFLAGIGLLMRLRWARWWVILLAIGLMALGTKGLIPPDHKKPANAPVQDATTHVFTDGLRTTSIQTIIIGAAIFLALISPSVRREFSTKKSSRPPALPNDSGEGWRVGHTGRDMMYYEEMINGAWQRIDISGEMLTGNAHHVIYFADASGWQAYPEWARHRRDEIIARVKSRFSPPEYEYYEGGNIPLKSSLSTPPTTHMPPTPKKPAKGFSSVLIMLCLGGFMLWMTYDGIQKGEVRLPAKYSTNRNVNVHEKPALFWTSIGIMGLVGTGCIGLCALALIPHKDK